MAEPTFTDGVASRPLAWLELRTKDDVVRPFAEVPLTDPSSYYGGYKDGRIVQWATASRGLSDRQGQIEQMAFGATLADTDRSIRGLLADATNRYLTNRPLVQRLIEDGDRRAALEARLVANGFVNDYSPRPNLQFDLKGTDWLKRKFSRAKGGQNAWQPVIDAVTFPDCPPDTLTQPAPVVYGRTGVSGADPVSGIHVSGVTPSDAAPTGFVGSATTGGFGGPGLTVHYALVYLAGGTGVPGDWGVESQVSHVSVTTDDPNTAVALSWDAAPMGARPVLFRSNWRSPIFSFDQYSVVDLADDATSFTDQWVGIDDGTVGVTGEAASPWYMGLRMNCEYYVMAFLAADVRTVPVSGRTTFTPIKSQQRQSLVLFLPYTDAVSYRIIRRRSFYADWDPAFDRQWDVIAGDLTPDGDGFLEFTDDDTSDISGIGSVEVPGGGSVYAQALTGQVKAIYVGKETIDGHEYKRLLVAAHACKRIGRIDVSVDQSGTDTTGLHANVQAFHRITDFGAGKWLSPSDPGTWPFFTMGPGPTFIIPYRVINGRRWTVLYTTAEPLPSTILVDVDGVEDIGNARGTLLTALTDQAKHFVRNYLAPDTPVTGDWQTTCPTFAAIDGLTLVDEESLDAVAAVHVDRVGSGGYEGATILGASAETVAALDALARFAVSGDFEWGWNRRGQLMATIEPETVPGDAIAVDDVIHIVDQSFDVTDPVTSEFFNVLPYTHTRDYTGLVASGWISTQLGQVDVHDDDSIAGYEQEIPSPSFALECLRVSVQNGAAIIADVMAHKLRRYKNPLRRVTLTVSLSGTSVELGDVIRVSHVEGVDTAGWQGRAIRVLRHEYDANQQQIKIEGYDLDQVLEAA